MSFFRQYIAPFFIVLIFLVAMVAVSARIFLPNDLAAPAPIEEPSAFNATPSTSSPESVAFAPNETVTPATAPRATVTIAQFYMPPATDTDMAQNG